MIQFGLGPFQNGLWLRMTAIVVKIGLAFLKSSKCMLIAYWKFCFIKNKNISILFNMKMLIFFRWQIKHGGGIVCIKSMPIWNQYIQLVLDIEKCKI